MSTHPRIWAVIPAAGAGRRFGADRPKQYLEINGRSVLAHTLSRLRRYPRIAGVVVVISDGDDYWPRITLDDAPAPLFVAIGGAERCHSVTNGLQRLLDSGAAETDWVMVHDAARPCLRTSDIDRLIDAALAHSVGAILGVPIADTVKRVDAGEICATVDRSALWRALTPQMFRVKALLDALQSALATGSVVTDESSAMELAGTRPLIVAGHADNIKITHAQDLYLAETILRHQEVEG